MANLSNFSCTCPDYRAAQDADPSARFLSQQIPRDWSSTGAGMKNNQRLCKHIIRALMLSGAIKEWDDLAGLLGYSVADFPTPNAAKYQPRDIKPRMNRNPRYGDDFS